MCEWLTEMLIHLKTFNDIWWQNIDRYICNIITHNKLIEHSSYIGTHMCCTNIMLFNMKTGKLQILKIWCILPLGGFMSTFLLCNKCFHAFCTILSLLNLCLHPLTVFFLSLFSMSLGFHWQFLMSFLSSFLVLSTSLSHILSCVLWDVTSLSLFSSPVLSLFCLVIPFCPSPVSLSLLCCYHCLLMLCFSFFYMSFFLSVFLCPL